MIVDIEQSITQVKRMILEGKVRSVQGNDVSVQADTLCIHGDQPQALAFVKRIRAALAGSGIEVKAIG